MDAATFTRFADLLIDDLAVTAVAAVTADSAEPGATCHHPGTAADHAGPAADHPGFTAPNPADVDSRSLGDLLADPRAVFDEPELLSVMVTAVRLANAAGYLLATVSATADRMGIPGRKHLKSSAHMLTELGVAPAAAHRATRVGNLARTLPTVTSAQREGAMSIEQADAIGRGLAHVASRVELSDAQRAEVVTTLTVQTTPAEVATRARAIAIALTPVEPVESGAVPVAEDYLLNEVTMHQNDDGRITGTFDIDIATGEGLYTALDPLCRPVPLPDGSPDPRTADRRRGDAFAEIIRSYLSRSQRPESGGVLPQVTLVRPPELWMRGPDGPPIGSPSSMDMSVDRLGYTGPVSPATAELIACDASLALVDVDDDGAPLDVGRAHRLFPPKLRKALIVRDQGCAFGGCGRPASWCDAHHMTSWAQGGATCVDNGVLLCRMHHTLIHHGGWEVFLGPDRHPWFRAPIDPRHPNRYREPIRSHARRTMTVLANAG